MKDSLYPASSTKRQNQANYYRVRTQDQCDISKLTQFTLERKKQGVKFRLRETNKPIRQPAT